MQMGWQKRKEQEMDKMRVVFDSSELGELSEMVKELIPFKENEVRYIHFPKPTQEINCFTVRKRLAEKLGWDYTRYQMLTIALDHNGRMGISLCSKKDRYNRRLGNTIAGNRLRDFDKIVLREKEKHENFI